MSETADAETQTVTKTRRDHLTTRERIIREVAGDPLALSGGFVVVLMVFLATFAVVDQVVFNRNIISMLWYDPYQAYPDNRLASPNLSHPMGTDQQGRDILARIIYGSKTSIIVGIGAVGIGSVIGVTIGAVTAYYGRIVDMIGMRTMDVLLSFPAILLAIAMIAILGKGIENVILALAIVYIPGFARVARSDVLSEASMEYVDAAKALGFTDFNVITDEILPNSLTPVIVQFTFTMALAIIAEASLSFLGLGISAPTATWGLMLSNGRNHILDVWWYTFFPGVAIMITVLGFNLIGDSLRDALDPQEQGEGRL